MEYIITVPVQHAHATQSHRNRRPNLRLVQGSRGENQDRARGGNRWRAALVAATVGCILSACGGGGSTQAAPTTSKVVAPVPASQPVASAPVAASAPTTSMPAIKIAIFGDDEMMGVSIDSHGAVTYISPNEAQVLQSLLRKDFSDPDITVVNESTGGRSSSLMNEIDGMDGGGAAEPLRMAQSGASIVIQSHAINDQYGGESVDDYSAYLAQWTQDAKAAGLTPVVEEPGPVCDGDHPWLGKYVTAMEIAANRYHVPIIGQYNATLSLDNWQRHMLNCITPDADLARARAAQDEAALMPIIEAQIGARK